MATCVLPLTATVQTTHARLFVAVAALARHAARCLPSITLLINLKLVQYVYISNLINAGSTGPEGNRQPGVYSRKYSTFLCQLTTLGLLI